MAPCCDSFGWRTVDTTVGRQESCCFGYWFVPVFIMLITSTSTWSLKAAIVDVEIKAEKCYVYTASEKKKVGIQKSLCESFRLQPTDPDREVLKLLLPYPWNCWPSFQMSFQWGPKSCFGRHKNRLTERAILNSSKVDRFHSGDVGVFERLRCEVSPCHSVLFSPWCHSVLSSLSGVSLSIRLSEPSS